MDYYRNVKLKSEVPEELDLDTEGEAEERSPAFVGEAVRDQVAT
jgi:hypothetical protein